MCVVEKRSRWSLAVAGDDDSSVAGSSLMAMQVLMKNDPGRCTAAMLTRQAKLVLYHQLRLPALRCMLVLPLRVYFSPWQHFDDHAFSVPTSANLLIRKVPVI